MRVAASATFMLCLALAGAQQPATRLKQGDLLGVVVQGVQEYSGDYTVSSDGTISGKGFGRILVSGKTVPQVQTTVTGLMSRYIKKPLVTVTLIRQRPEVVFITGSKASNAAFEHHVGLDVRQLLSTAQLPGDTERTDVMVFRAGKKIAQDTLREILIGKSAVGSTRLEPNDMVSVNPVDTRRVWMTGLITRPGEIEIPQTADLYQAVAAAGGISAAYAGDQELRIVVRRGPNQQIYPLQAQGVSVPLEAGDTISIVAPSEIRITVAGEVRLPSSFAFRDGKSVLAAIAKAGGLTERGSYQDVSIIRGDKTFFPDLGNPTKTGTEPAFQLQDGDVVMVRPNERTVLVMGEVLNRRPIFLRESRAYRLSDILAEAGGISARGTSVRIYLGRKGKNGKVTVTRLRFDKYLKDGDLTQNPIVQPDDVVMVDTAKPTSVELITQALSNAIYVATLRKF